MKKKTVVLSSNMDFHLPFYPKSSPLSQRGTPAVCTAPPEEPLITAIPEPTPTKGTQEETPIMERETGVNDLCESYPYKSKGMPDADKMHPSYRPPAPYVAKSTPYVAPALSPSPPQEETSQEERPPHFWHWVKAGPAKACVTYTPSLAARRRSIPAIACSLYYSAWACWHAKDMYRNAPPGYVKTNEIFYQVDQRKVERLKDLLAFCGVGWTAIGNLTSEAWSAAKASAAKEAPTTVVWSSIAKRLLLSLGYELGEKEPDGSFDATAASFADFAEKEGIKGR